MGNSSLAPFPICWNGGSWVDVPGGAVTANNLVWRQFNFTPLTTDRIRVLVNGAFGSYARIAELEAWGTAASGGAGGGGGGATPAAGIYFIEADHLETPRLISNAQQQVVWRWDQAEPFGDTPPNDNPSNLGTFEFNLRFPGQYRDKETNLNYNFFRDYDPGLGRYLQSDPIGLRGGLNTYLYVKANPLSGVDPLGLEPGTLAQRGYPAADPSPSAGSLFGLTTAVSSFWRNYQDMRQANTIGADKYFHCMANCQASKGGLLGLAAAQCMSDGREWFDQNVKGDPPWASEQDQGANRQGQLQGFFRQDRCQIICDNLRPPGLSPTY